jgi:NADH dehydrogenase (ubiquinone) 1 alpha subcomplex subunit 9
MSGNCRNFDLEDVHVEGAERIAEAVAKYDVDRFVHVSSYNADKNSPSEFFRTKARGEEVVRSIFPETTIVRPAPMFGFEDRLLNRLASNKRLITSNHMKERYWPVHAIDVGMALEHMINDDTTAEQTYELYGPTNYSTEEIADIVDKEIMKQRRHINIPKRVVQPVSYALNKALWWPVGSADEVEREFIDQKIDPAAKTFKDLEIEPVELKSVTFEYLVSQNLLYQLFGDNLLICDSLYRKDIEARQFTICHPKRNGKSERSGNTCMY